MCDVDNRIEVFGNDGVLMEGTHIRFMTRCPKHGVSIGGWITINDSAGETLHGLLDDSGAECLDSFWVYIPNCVYSRLVTLFSNKNEDLFGCNA